MARYAEVFETAGFVVNVVEWDGNDATWAPPAGYVMVEDANGQASPGFMWDGTKFTPPPGSQPDPLP